MPETLRIVLAERGLADLYDSLAAHDIEPDMLADLTEQDMREIGLSLGQRIRLTRALTDGQPPQHPPAEAERRQLTTLFCDLVGSTELATLLDPEDLRDAFSAYQALVAEVADNHDGHVAYSQGDGVMVYFGYPRAAEDDPERAVRAGLELVDRIRQLKTAAPRPLAARVGIATGIVVVSDSRSGPIPGSNVIGETPNLAARLQQLADPDQVVIAEITYRRCRQRFECTSLGAVAAKGFAEPVAVWRVIAENTAGRFAVPQGAAPAALVGRDAELAQIASLWDAARSGSGKAVLISGEPGIGKSRLAHAFLASLPPGGFQSLSWHCAAHLSNRPLHPIAREVAQTAGLARDTGTLARQSTIQKFVTRTPGLEAADAPWVAELLGAEGPARPEQDAQGRARRLTDAMVRRIEGLARQKPLVILLEDAHWSDMATIEFVTTLLPRLAGVAVLLIVTHRPEMAAPWPDVPTIALTGIDRDAAMRLTRDIVLDRPLPPTVLQAIVDKAAGVPLFVEELTRTLIDAMQEEGDGPGGMASVTVPATLQDSLMARLDRLGDAKELAQLGSVIGREFSPEMIRLIAPPRMDVMENLRRLCESGLAAWSGDGDTVIFRHALIQDTAYETLLKKRRRAAHGIIARAMLAKDAVFAGAEPEIIARHCGAAGLDEAAMRHWLLAGRQAMDRAASHAAAASLNKALHHLNRLPAGEERAKAELEIQMALTPVTMAVHGWASPQAGAVCRRALALAIEVGDVGAEFATRWGMWSNCLLGGRVADTITEGENVWAIAEAQGQGYMRLSAHHARCFTQYTVGQFRELVTTMEAGLALDDPEQERVSLRLFQLSPITSMGAIGSTAYWYLGETEKARETARMTLVRAEALNHPPNLVQAASIISYQHLYAEDWVQLAEVSGRLLQIAQEEGLFYWMAVHQMHLAICNQADPAMVAAVTAGVTDQFAAMGSPLTLNTYLPFMGRAMIQTGQAAEAEKRLTARIADARQRGETNNLSEVLRIRAEARHNLGDTAGAEKDFDAALSLASAQHARPLVAAVIRSREKLLDAGLRSA
jgi:class 3 adenylate cyclase/tetratricopeptide (TPR) repeat protein